MESSDNRYLTFIIEDETYAVEIGYVTEIIGIQPITVVPEMPNYLRGIINIRGKIIPVMDLRLRFERELLPYTERTCVIIIDVEDISLGYIVDEMSEVVTIAAEELSEPPDTGNATGQFIKAVSSVEDDVRMVLDCRKLAVGTDG